MKTTHKKPLGTDTVENYQTNYLANQKVRTNFDQNAHQFHQEQSPKVQESVNKQIQLSTHNKVIIFIRLILSIFLHSSLEQFSDTFSDQTIQTLIKIIDILEGFLCCFNYWAALYLLTWEYCDWICRFCLMTIIPSTFMLHFCIRSNFRIKEQLRKDNLTHQIKELKQAQLKKNIEDLRLVNALILFQYIVFFSTHAELSNFRQTQIIVAMISIVLSALLQFTLERNIMQINSKFKGSKQFIHSKKHKK